MKYFIHSIVLIVVFQSYSVFGQLPENNMNKIDTMIIKQWLNGAWVNQARTYNNFNTDCSINTSTSQVWENGVWKNSGLNSFTYLPTKKINQSTVSIWMDPGWVAFNRTTKTYNATLQLVRDLHETNFGMGWTIQSENLFTYNTSNSYLIKDLMRNWNGTQFLNSDQTDYTHNSSGGVISDRTQKWNGTGWVNYDSASYTLNGLNQVTFAIYFDWINNLWVNYLRSTGTYVGGNLTVVIDQIWKNSAWVNDARHTLTYDSKNRVKTVLSENWSVELNNWVNDAFIELIYTSTCSALPLTLLNFEATKSSGDVSLKWETTNEINTSGFDIERSIDGINFITIGTVRAGGDQISNHYSYLDKTGSNLHGIIYYRLRMTDLDGKFSMSNVAKVNIDSRATVSIFPNPVKDKLLFVTGVTMNNGDIVITGQDGKNVFSQKFPSIHENAKNTINVSNLSAGIYILRISDKNRTITNKFIKH
ncbi:MAG: T9SS type A sorting domain-containing protein [Ginsengibacter sp.]